MTELEETWPSLNWKELEETVFASSKAGERPPACLGSCGHAVFLAATRYLHENGGRLTALSATRGENADEVVLTYTFEVGQGGQVRLRAFSESMGIDSLFSLFACADFLEREVNHLFGIKFLGHPNLSYVIDGGAG